MFSRSFLAGKISEMLKDECEMLNDSFSLQHFAFSISVFAAWLTADEDGFPAKAAAGDAVVHRR
jgi:hypothetical protein